MGFWHTGYIEFHEPSGIDEWCRPAPPVFRCAHCGKTFENPATLRQHRFEVHPYKRPLMFIRGTELGSTPLTITRAINPSEVATGACAGAFVNGAHVSLEKLGEILASTKQDVLRIDLEGEATRSSFEVRFDVATEEDLVGVERAFYEVARRHRLDIRSIEQFLDSASAFNTALGYCDGICEYLYGILAKERSPDSSLAYEAYREKFTRALDKLVAFDRTLANRVCGLIEFHFNHFPEAAFLSSNSRVGHAATAFEAWLSGKPKGETRPKPTEDDQRLESMLTDWDTEQLLRWAIRDLSALSIEQAAIERMLSAGPAEFDQTKLHVLLAQIGLSTSNPAMVRAHARQLRNSPSMAHWADAVIEISKGSGEL